MTDSLPELPHHIVLTDQAVPVINELGLVEGYSTSTIVNAAVFQYAENIIATLAFIYGTMHQTQLSTSSNYIVWIIVVVAIGLAGTHLLEYLRRPDVKWRPWIVQFVVKITVVIVAYFVGLFARIVADWFLNGPSRGPFSIYTLLMPLFLIVLLAVILYRDQMTHALPAELIRSLDAPLAKAPPGLPKHTKSPPQQPIASVFSQSGPAFMQF